MREKDTIAPAAKLAQFQPTENERLRLILQAALCLVSARNLLNRAEATQASAAVSLALRASSRAMHNRRLAP